MNDQIGERKKISSEACECVSVMCTACDAACDGCIGPGTENCELCQERHYLDDNGACQRMSTLPSLNY